jgi:hypothetical protein
MLALIISGLCGIMLVLIISALCGIMVALIISALCGVMLALIIFTPALQVFVENLVNIILELCIVADW